MKVLVADKFETSGIEGLKAAGCEVVYEPDLKDDALVQAIANIGRMLAGKLDDLVGVPHEVVLTNGLEPESLDAERAASHCIDSTVVPVRTCGRTPRSSVTASM